MSNKRNVIDRKLFIDAHVKRKICAMKSFAEKKFEKPGKPEIRMTVAIYFAGRNNKNIQI